MLLLLFLQRLYNAKYVVTEPVTDLQITGEDLCNHMLLLFLIWTSAVNVHVHETKKLQRVFCDSANSPLDTTFLQMQQTGLGFPYSRATISNFSLHDALFQPDIDMEQHIHFKFVNINTSMSWFIPHVFLQMLTHSPKWNFHVKYCAFKWYFALVIVFFLGMDFRQSTQHLIKQFPWLVITIYHVNGLLAFTTSVAYFLISDRHLKS